jgi:hypothetical protein
VVAEVTCNLSRHWRNGIECVVAGENVTNFLERMFGSILAASALVRQSNYRNSIKRDLGRETVDDARRCIETGRELKHFQ